MGQNAQTKTQDTVTAPAGKLANWFAVPTHHPVADKLAELFPRLEDTEAQQATASPGFLAWFFEGMKMEARAGRWY